MAEAAPLAKGSNLIDLVKLARKEREAFVKVLPEETRAFIENQILVGSWYPEVHLENLLVAADRVHGKGDLNHCRALGNMAAKSQFQTVYRSAVVPGDPVATLSFISIGWSLLHNTGKVTMEVPEAGVVRVRLASFGRPSTPQCAALVGWLEGIVQIAGGRGQATEERCRTRGEVACLFSVRWSLAA